MSLLADLECRKLFLSPGRKDWRGFDVKLVLGNYPDNASLFSASPYNLLWRKLSRLTQIDLANYFEFIKLSIIGPHQGAVR